MTTVAQLVPRQESVEVGALLRALRRAPRPRAEPFDPIRIDFSEALSRAIFRDPRVKAFPALTAAAYWLRRAAVSRLAERFAALEATGSARAARGLALHLPPTNVDTLLLYSVMTSLLVGNLNVARVSATRPTEQVGLLCELLRSVLAEDRFAELAEELAIVAYGHEPEPTALISREADVRLVWGGDETVRRVRAFPLGPAGHDLAFGDRFSFAVVRPGAVLAADESARQALARSLFNDAYWFDQMGCASPRLIVWVGDRAEADAAREVLYDHLARAIDARGYRLAPGAALAKLTFTYGALIDRRVARVHQAGSELVVISLDDLADFDRTHPGAGLFFEARVDALDHLVRFVERKDQTLTAHGFTQDELTAFARSLHGRGVDRIVPFGEALSFGTVWDGYDLLAELTRTIAVTA